MNSVQFALESLDNPFVTHIYALSSMTDMTSVQFVLSGLDNASVCKQRYDICINQKSWQAISLRFSNKAVNMWLAA